MSEAGFGLTSKGGGGSAVTSVDGLTGAVSLTASYAALTDARIIKSALATTVNAVTASSGTTTVNLANGLTVVLTMTATSTISFINWPTGGVQVNLEVVQNATGGYVPTFSGVTWLPAVPVWVTTANAVTALSLFTTNGGSTYYGVGALTVFLGTTSVPAATFRAASSGSEDIVDITDATGGNVWSFWEQGGRFHATQGINLGGTVYTGNQVYGNSGNLALTINDTGGAVNSLAVNTAATGNAPYFGCNGSDTNIDILFSPKGTGRLKVNGGGIDIINPGAGLAVVEGSNCKQGTAVLVAGSKVVSNTSVTTTSRILLTSNADGGAPGWLRVSARTAGTSFTITSSSGTDTSTVAFQIFEVG